MLSNEQLFELIQNGNEDLKPVLWERVKKLLYMFAGRYYSKYTDYCSRHGVTEWDLKQQAYIAYENSFAGYDCSRGKYSNYLLLMLKTSLRELFHSSNPLNFADSLEREINTDEPEGFTVGDFVPDPEASGPFEQIEDSSERSALSQTLQEEIKKLPEKEQAVINGKYYSGKSFTDIARELHISGQRTSQIHGEALRHLRSSRIIRRLQDDLGYSSYRLYNRHCDVEYIATERVWIEDILRREAREAAVNA